jgi:redox-sensitive bicupin YhaK (pirin superfamily)
MGPQLQLSPQTKDLGDGLAVRRLLPAPQRQAVGPFVFMDHFGPVTVLPDAVPDIRAHPHIGLAAITYLLDGALVHRDSLGGVQRIEPGDVNWLTAGRGVVHSERAPEDMQQTRYVNHGLQLWAALPRAFEACDPSLQHTAAPDVTQCMVAGTAVRVLVGEAFDCKSPIQTHSPTVLLDVRLKKNTVFELPCVGKELAVYALDGDITVNNAAVPAHTLALLSPDVPALIESPNCNRLIVLGGDPLDAPRIMWWNFVSSRQHRIAQAAQDWSAHAFGYSVGEGEIIPLPERREKVDRRKKPRVTERRE